MDIEAIVKDCQNGSRDAFAFLYQTYSLPMMGVISYYVHNNDIVKDILHDGFIVAFTSIGSLKDATKVESWLTTIMKNLSLQYLRREAEHISIPMSDTAIPEQLAEPREETDLSWEQLEAIIRQLPDGYGTVFRLNVLQGLSHKEIAKLLGISHLTSASQLHHAKAMLRRMIYQYRKEMGLLSIIVAVTFIVYDFIMNRSFQEKPTSTDVDNTLFSNKTSNESIAVNCDSSTVVKKAKTIVTTYTQVYPTEDKDIEPIKSVKDTTVVVSNDSIASDSITLLPTNNNPHIYIYIANTAPESQIKPSNKKDWTFSLAYSGTMGQDNRLTQLIPDISSGIPGQDMEEKKKTKHHIPVTIGLSISKSISNRWSLESGLRYTYLRTDIYTENKYNSTETIQKIHYIGVPLKFGYKIFKTNRFSIYGQAGFVLDIPINGTSHTYEYNYRETTPYINKSKLEMPLQWSIEGGLGVQYQFTPNISIYAEPSFNYYFNSGTSINTIRQDKPFEFTIPIGIRMTW